jgi:hypothetical protein
MCELRIFSQLGKEIYPTFSAWFSRAEWAALSHDDCGFPHSL